MFMLMLSIKKDNNLSQKDNNLNVDMTTGGSEPDFAYPIPPRLPPFPCPAPKPDGSVDLPIPTPLTKYFPPSP